MKKNGKKKLQTRRLLCPVVLFDLPLCYMRSRPPFLLCFVAFDGGKIHVKYITQTPTLFPFLNEKTNKKGQDNNIFI